MKTTNRRQATSNARGPTAAAARRYAASTTAALTLVIAAVAATTATAGRASQEPGAAVLTLDDFRPGAGTCYDRSEGPQTAVVDTHVHFRPFGGAPIPFDEVVGYLEATGVLFANVYGIGQMLPAFSGCTYYLDCPGTPLRPTLHNDLANATSLAAAAPERVRLTASLTFPDPADPASVTQKMELVDAGHPGVFGWMGEVNLVKQAVFANGRGPVPDEAVDGWAPFMTALRERGMPLSIHADLGSDEEPTRYLPLMRRVMETYPDNPIVWMHMGLSRELTTMNPREHAALMAALLGEHPKLMLDISWRVLDDAYFSTPEGEAVYVPFLNEHSERILPGTDFLASRDKDLEVYRNELAVTSRILRLLEDGAFENIALGRNYFRLLGLDYEAPRVCRPE